jgi:hypothetical protein
MRQEIDEGIVSVKRIFQEKGHHLANMIEGHSFEDDKRFAGLQAADLLAYEVRKRATAPNTQRTSYTRLTADRDHVFSVCHVAALPLIDPTHGVSLSWRFGDECWP